MITMSGKKNSKSRTGARARVECFMLCDYASEENDKLYIVGGGWDRLRPRQLPTVVEFHIAIKLAVSFQEALGPLHIVLETTDEDGELMAEPAELNITPHPSQVLPAGPEHTFLLPLQANLEIQQRGRYSVRLKVNGEPAAQTTFHVDKPSSSVESGENDFNGESPDPSVEADQA